MWQAGIAAPLPMPVMRPHPRDTATAAHSLPSSQRDKERRAIEEGEGERDREGSAYACTSQSPACQRIHPPRLPPYQPSPWRVTCQRDAFKGRNINEHKGLDPSPRVGSSQQGAGGRGSAAAQSLSVFEHLNFTVSVSKIRRARSLRNFILFRRPKMLTAQRWLSQASE